MIFKGNMITKGKLTIFDSFGGNEDSLARVGRDFEKRQFENNEWKMINSLYQDIELINKNLTSKIFVEKTILTLKENCDSEAFDFLSRKIIGLK